MLSEVEIRAIAQSVVDKAKSTAHVEQGSLKKSIAYTYVRGLVTFRQLYYGQWNENSQLEKYAKQMMPNGVAYKVVLTKLGGDTYEVGKTKQGRTTQRKAVATAVKSSTGNVKRLIALVQVKRKRNGKAEE